MKPFQAGAEVSPPIQLMTLIRAGRVSQSISVAAQLGVADQLAKGPRRADELAEAVGAHPGALRRLLRLLAEVGVFAEFDGGTFALTPVGELLRSDAEGSLRALSMVLEAPYWRATWTNLIQGVRTGDAAFAYTHGQHWIGYLRQHPDDAAMFDQAMAGVSRHLIAAVLDVYDFGQFHTVVDLGGGNGALLAAILTRHPGARGVLHELPDVAARAAASLAGAGVADRCDVVQGDFFRSVPAGGDAYVLARVIHDWDDQAALRILHNCRAAMAEDARVLLVEAVLPDGSEPSLVAKLVDMEMLVVGGGRERTAAEYRELLGHAGLRLARVVPSAGAHHLIEAVAASAP